MAVHRGRLALDLRDARNDGKGEVGTGASWDSADGCHRGTGRERAPLLVFGGAAMGPAEAAIATARTALRRALGHQDAAALEPSAVEICHRVVDRLERIGGRVEAHLALGGQGHQLL